MALISVQAKLTTEDLFAAIEQLEPADADKVSRRLNYLRAHRRTPYLADREAELLQRVYQDKRSGFRERYDQLNTKCSTWALTPEEHAELLALTDESELFDAQRLDALAELAKIRGVKLPFLMKQLGLKAPPVV